MLLTNVANDIPLSIWYDWRDDGDDPKEAEHRFGIVRRKPTGDAKQPFEPKVIIFLSVEWKNENDFA